MASRYLLAILQALYRLVHMVINLVISSYDFSARMGGWAAEEQKKYRLYTN